MGKGSDFKWMLLGVLALLAAGGLVSGVWSGKPGKVHTDVNPKVSHREYPSPTRGQPYRENFAREQLMSLYRNCELFWEQEGTGTPCTPPAISEPPYTFSLNPPDRPRDEGTVEIKIESGGMDSFFATAQHEESEIVWGMDSAGRVRCINFDPEECEARTHLSRQEVLDEVREFAGPVDDNATSIEVK
ncbi:MAG: hypothetical protein COV67_12195 [Nitrospinae bacterium CG11_big_fil_rev_8_21_14_0_20_56_8]|nr:MAG: hypothetical protein COV67_12195 [Nitrospinae bacterium CG11_big_fil_rev_8_21_14_0_20_56_8]